MKRILTLAVFLAVAVAAAHAQAPSEAPTQAIMGRPHVIVFRLPGGTEIGLQMLTRGNEPLVSPDAPRVLNPKAVLMLAIGDVASDHFARGFASVRRTEYQDVRFQGATSFPPLPAGTTARVISGDTPLRTIVRPHVDHGPFQGPHFDFVTFYPLPPEPF